MNDVTISKIRELICSRDFESIKLGASFILEYDFKKWNNYFKDIAKYLLFINEYPSIMIIVDLDYMLNRYMVEIESI